MKVRTMSDLHIEFFDFKPIEVPADVIVLAGDILTIGMHSTPAVVGLRAIRVALSNRSAVFPAQLPKRVAVTVEVRSVRQRPALT